MALQFSKVYCLAALGLSACFTEVGNPGKTQGVSASFSIDYVATPPDLPKASAQSQTPTPAPTQTKVDSPLVQISQFYFNVVEVNYTTADDVDGRIWKVPDSMGSSIDFTGKDPSAVLSPVRVPLGDWAIMKLESRIPDHDTLLADTVDFATFHNRGYIKGEWISDSTTIRFICQMTDDYKINLVYSQEMLEQWRHNDVYELEFIFYASKWISAVSLPNALTYPDRTGNPIVIIDQEHNAEMFPVLKAKFFKSFNSYKVWKENPAK